MPKRRSIWFVLICIFLSLFDNIVYIHIIAQVSPCSLFRPFSSYMDTLHTLSTNSPFCWPTVPNNHHWLYVSMTLITLYCINEVSQTLWLTSFKLLILIMVLTTHEKKGKNIMLNFQYGLNIIWSYIQLAWRKPVCYLKTKPIPKEKGEIYSHNIKAIKRSIERQKCLNNLKSFDYLNVYIFKYIYINLYTHIYIYPKHSCFPSSKLNFC